MKWSREEVARRAYDLFLARGAAHGHDLEDWLEAERQLVAQTAGSPGKVGVTPTRRRLAAGAAKRG